jgi:hypothetical protein
MTALLGQFVLDFVRAMVEVDKDCPGKPGKAYGPGIGPLDEPPAIKMVLGRLAADGLYRDQKLQVPYGHGQLCDICLGNPPQWDWAIEAKMLRAKRANGDPEHQNIGHILSPYPNAGSALSDCPKLASFTSADRKAILIFGYDYDDWPMRDAIDAFEMLARARVALGDRQFAPLAGLTHPVHRRGGVFAWELLDRA